MTLHLIFTDGSNPFVSLNLDPEGFARELLRWAENYNLSFCAAAGSVITLKAAEKRNVPDLFRN